MLESEADLRSFLDTDEFATPAVYTPSASPSVAKSICVIFDLPDERVEVGRAEVVGGPTTARCLVIDIKAPHGGDAVQVDQVAYTVKGYRRTSDGKFWILDIVPD